MPWEIKRGTSQCSGYGVFKEGTSELEGCHTTREAAERQMAALYASEPEAAQKEVITNETTPNKYPQSLNPKRKKRRVMVDTTKSMHTEDEEEEMKEKGYKDKEKSIDSDSAAPVEVPADLSSIFTNMPTHAKRINTTGNAPVSFPLFREDDV